MRRFISLIVVALAGAACGDAAEPDPARFCEIASSFERFVYFDPIDANAPGEVETEFRRLLELMDEGTKVAPDAIRPAAERVAAGSDAALDLLEDSGFDLFQIDPTAGAAFVAEHGEALDAASVEIDNWASDNC